MAKKRWSVVFLLLALLAAGGYVWREGLRQPPVPTTPSAPATAAMPVNPEVPGAARLPKRPQARTVPLPPPGAPINEIVGPLQARADAGDSRAACRLAMELLRCAHLDQSKGYRTPDGRPMDVILAERGNLEAADLFAELEIRSIELRQRCETVDPDLLAQAPRYLRAAARAGEPEAMLRYAIGTQHGVPGAYGFVRDPDLDAWRRESPAMLLEAMRRGRPEAVNLLLTAYQGDGTPYAGLIANDPVVAHAYRLLRQKMWGIVNDTPEDIDPAGLVRAAELANGWHAKYFDNRVPGKDRSGLQLPQLAVPNKPLEEDRFCEPSTAPARG